MQDGAHVQMATEFNDWLESTLKKSRHVVQDADRKAFMDVLLRTTIREAHQLLVTNALTAPRPEIKREVSEGAVTLALEWRDEESGWWLALLVTRRLGEKPKRVLEFSGADEQYVIPDPAVSETRKAMYAYFENWKRGR